MIISFVIFHLGLLMEYIHAKMVIESRFLLIVILLLSFSRVTGQNVTIPDANFKSYLLANSSINSNDDNEIQVSEASAYTGTIDCSIMSITDLTGIEEFTALSILRCHYNNITNLDVSQNTVLVQLTCADNLLTNLNVSQNTELIHFSCENNFLSSLDVSQNSVLNYLSCNNNSLTGLDVSQNTILTYLNCTNNFLTNLNVSQNYSLAVLGCSYNNLTSLNVANGNNTSFYSNFNALGNPNLVCIQVDNAAWSEANWTQIDATVSFSTNCAGTISLKEKASVNMDIYPNPVQNVLFLQIEGDQIIEMSILDLSGKVVQLIRNSNPKSVDVSFLLQGVYIINANTTKGSVTQRFVKL